jgi:hypothetical protein
VFPNQPSSQQDQRIEALPLIFLNFLAALPPPVDKGGFMASWFKSLYVERAEDFEPEFPSRNTGGEKVFYIFSLLVTKGALL